MHQSSRLTLAFLAVAVSGAAAGAQNFDFKASPHISLNRVYRVDRVTGEMGACQYGLVDNSVGATLCYPAGDGATAQPPGEYGLVASSHQQESGIFRVNRKTGDMSICYVLNDEKIVCTPQAREAVGVNVAKAPEPAKPTK
ncbi:MAG: hypothetical protein K2P80_09970 [Beijerinckiaceae bacterium]|nr:hypothetical protein [Beijerinckiaceae bacterium]